MPKGPDNQQEWWEIPQDVNFTAVSQTGSRPSGFNARCNPLCVLLRAIIRPAKQWRERAPLLACHEGRALRKHRLPSLRDHLARVTRELKVAHLHTSHSKLITVEKTRRGQERTRLVLCSFTCVWPSRDVRTSLQRASLTPPYSPFFFPLTGLSGTLKIT